MRFDLGLKRNPTSIAPDGMRPMAVEWLKGMIPPYRQNDAELMEAIIHMFEQKTPDVFETQMLALLGRPDANPVLGRIQCPALVLTKASP